MFFTISSHYSCIICLWSWCMLDCREDCQCIKEPPSIFHLHLKHCKEKGIWGHYPSNGARHIPQLSKQSKEAWACVLSAACWNACLNSLNTKPQTHYCPLQESRIYLLRPSSEWQGTPATMQVPADKMVLSRHSRDYNEQQSHLY